MESPSKRNRALSETSPNRLPPKKRRAAEAPQAPAASAPGKAPAAAAPAFSARTRPRAPAGRGGPDFHCIFAKKLFHMLHARDVVYDPKRLEAALPKYFSCSLRSLKRQFYNYGFLQLRVKAPASHAPVVFRNRLLAGQPVSALRRIQNAKKSTMLPRASARAVPQKHDTKHLRGPRGEEGDCEDEDCGGEFDGGGGGLIFDIATPLQAGAPQMVIRLRYTRAPTRALAAAAPGERAAPPTNEDAAPVEASLAAAAVLADAADAADDTELVDVSELVDDPVAADDAAAAGDTDDAAAGCDGARSPGPATLFGPAPFHDAADVADGAGASAFDGEGEPAAWLLDDVESDPSNLGFFLDFLEEEGRKTGIYEPISAAPAGAPS
ncbi:hypothetical protein M885DRAFT_574778 [Pelagophyceae sp. CCMP2097]|nr:hypothetical protein M885DRAFT_574778 [Pelagophyceae sp. CCMP2097]